MLKFDTPIAFTIFVFKRASIAEYVSAIGILERRKTPVSGSKGKNLPPDTKALGKILAHYTRWG